MLGTAGRVLGSSTVWYTEMPAAVTEVSRAQILWIIQCVSVFLTNVKCLVTDIALFLQLGL